MKDCNEALAVVKSGELCSVAKCLGGMVCNSILGGMVCNSIGFKVLASVLVDFISKVSCLSDVDVAGSTVIIP